MKYVDSPAGWRQERNLAEFLLTPDHFWPLDGPAKKSEDSKHIHESGIRTNTSDKTTQRKNLTGPQRRPPKGRTPSNTNGGPYLRYSRHIFRLSSLCSLPLPAFKIVAEETPEIFHIFGFHGGHTRPQSMVVGMAPACRCAELIWRRPPEAMGKQGSPC